MNYPSGNTYRAWMQNGNNLVNARIFIYHPDGTITERECKNFYGRQLAHDWINKVINEFEDKYKDSQMSDWQEIDL